MISNAYSDPSIHPEIHEASLLQEAMEQVIELKVPLVAEVHQGKSWYEAKYTRERN